MVLIDAVMAGCSAGFAWYLGAPPWGVYAVGALVFFVQRIDSKLLERR